MYPWILASLAALFIVVLSAEAIQGARKRPGWPKWTGFEGKTVWNLLELLIVPAVLGGIALRYGTFETNRQLAIENRREEAQVAIEKNRMNEEVLQGYFDDMTQLILHHDLRSETIDGSGTRAEYTDAQIIARARSLTMLSALDGKRNGMLLRFLLETNLFDLIKAERLEIDLRGAVIVVYDLSGASLNRSDLREAILVRTNLSQVIFLDAKLGGAWLMEADLSEAVLINADLSGADLEGANLEGACYDDGTTWPEGFDPSEAGAVKTARREWIDKIQDSTEAD